ncbi:MAG: polysaccharide biosynthesis C-terminal domain-containing protein [Microscillaceae bacterium]|nr:polysaccharide biosynthesis C-terminal domain-containing protein [Microscillaceae bacterium]
MSLLKKLAGQTVLYGLSTIVGRSVNFLLVFIHTAVFLDYEFGGMTAFYAYVAFFNILYTYGMETAFFRYAKPENRQEIYNLIQSYLIVSTVIFSVILIFFSPSLAEYVGYPDRQEYVVWLVAIIAIDTLVAIPFARLRLEEKARRFALVKIINILLNVFLNVFFLVFCHQIVEGNWLPALKPIVSTFYFPSMGIGYVFLANLIANALTFVQLYDLFLKFKFRLHWVQFRPILWYAFPLLIMGIAGTVNAQIDKIMLDNLLPDDFYSGKTARAAMGIYAACFKLSVFMNLVIQAFRYAAEPFFFAQSNDKRAPELFARVMHYFILVCVLLWLVLCFNLDLLKIIFLRNPVYYEGILVVPILLLANLLLGIYYNLTVWFKLSDRTYFGTYISLLGALITLLGNFILIPVLGYMGAAWTMLFAYTVMACVCYAYGQRYFPIPYRLKAAGLHLGLATVLVWVSLQWREQGLLISTLLNLGLLGLYGAFLAYTEKNQVLALIKKFRTKPT